MAEEKIVTVNLRRKLESIPRWKRRASFGRILRETLKKDVKIGQDLNSEMMKGAVKVRIKITKDDKSIKAELAK